MSTLSIPPGPLAQAVTEDAPLRGPGRQAYTPGRGISPAAVAVMVGAHALLGWGLMNGLGSKAMEIIKKPLEATIVQEVVIPPPPPPPPPPPKLEQRPPPRPDVAPPPPPAYVPPPEVTPPAVVAPPPITAVQSQVAVAPPPAVPPPPPAPPAPPAPVPPPAPAAPQKADIAVACPKQVPPEVPEQAIDDGISGTVKAELRIKAGKVVGVQILSGPRVFHAAVRRAAAAYGCTTPPDVELIAIQEFTFKVE